MVRAVFTNRWTMVQVQATQLRVIVDSETFSATTKYLGQKKVEAVFSFRRDAKSQRYEKKAVFNFDAVTEEELFLLVDRL